MNNKNLLNLINITVVMPTIDWNGTLGQKVRDEIGLHVEKLIKQMDNDDSKN